MWEIWLVNGSWIKWSKKSVIPKEMLGKDLDLGFESLTYYPIKKVSACSPEKQYINKVDPDGKSFPYVAIECNCGGSEYTVFRCAGDVKKVSEIIDALENGKSVKLCDFESSPGKVVQFLSRSEGDKN